MKYKFYGADSPAVQPIASEFSAVKDQRHLYDLLSDIWCEYSCAPRLRPEWSEENKTLGQCSITAFLVQDIFGGEVYGVKLENGGLHCYNIVGESKFDLTSEQFLGKPIEYNDDLPQSREIQFSDKDKYERYLYLKSELKKKLSV